MLFRASIKYLRQSLILKFIKISIDRWKREKSLLVIQIFQSKVLYCFISIYQSKRQSSVIDTYAC